MKNTEFKTEETTSYDPQEDENITADFDYDHVLSPARVAIYDDLLSSPRVIEIQPADTRDFIENLATQIYNSSHEMGGAIPYHAIRQMSENFIHAKFHEVVVSILDSGNTIRFTDQGPGIQNKELAQQPGFSSATKEMKLYIDGVGSGLPIVNEYLSVKDGFLSIEDNLNGGSVVTLSLKNQTNQNPQNLEPVFKEIQPQYQQGANQIRQDQYNQQIPVQQMPSQFNPTYQQGFNQSNSYIDQQFASQMPPVYQNMQQNSAYGYNHPQFQNNQAAFTQQPSPQFAQNTPNFIGQAFTQMQQIPLNSYQQTFQGGMTPETTHYNNAIQSVTSSLSHRMLEILAFMLQNNTVGVTDIKDNLDIPQSSVSAELRKLEESGLIQKIGTKRQLTPFGREVASSL